MLSITQEQVDELKHKVSEAEWAAEVLKADLRAAREEIERLKKRIEKAETEVRATLEAAGPNYVACREEGGAEDIYASLAVTVSKLQVRAEKAERERGEAQKESKTRRMQVAHNYQLGLESVKRAVVAERERDRLQDEIDGAWKAVPPWVRAQPTIPEVPESLMGAVSAMAKRNNGLEAACAESSALATSRGKQITQTEAAYIELRLLCEEALDHASCASTDFGYYKWETAETFEDRYRKALKDAGAPLLALAEAAHEVAEIHSAPGRCSEPYSDSCDCAHCRLVRADRARREANNARP